MEEALCLKPIAYIKTDFGEKFGIPRQSGLVEELQAKICFLPEFSAKECFRGIEEFSHLWLIWGFSENYGKSWSPTVRPPRLGGNVRKGVFATRSPFRPNPVGLSCVKLLAFLPDDPEGPSLLVSGADLMNGTPVFDVKPYVPIADCRPEASGSFSDEKKSYHLEVDFPAELEEIIPQEKRAGLRKVLMGDPRPSYHHDPERLYGMNFAGYNISFTVDGDLLKVKKIVKST